MSFNQLLMKVMGLYFGAIEGDVAVVRSLIPIRRTTKEKDRVEIDPVDLAKASEKAEAVGLRIVGWYHSHPHITVHPSHVDLATQYNYQSHLDTHFFGLIFSVFNYDTKLEQDIREVIAFRTNRTEEGNFFFMSGWRRTSTGFVDRVLNSENMV